MQRFSKNRQAILECLMNTVGHPDAEWIYEKLKPAYPNLSLGTVYRNLKQLEEDHKIRSMGISAGTEHFDAVVSPHPHVVCMQCGKIRDIEENEATRKLLASLKDSTEFSIHEFRLYGLCAACREKDACVSE